MTIEKSVEYRYFLTDLLTNEIVSEVPFKGVTYQRTNKRAGEFSGTIPFIEATKGLNLYEATMPGRSGLYVMRNGACVWGGIIWTRRYSVESEELEVNASEFMSYFYHRNIWQTLQYGSEFIGIAAYLVVETEGTITTEIPHGFSVGDKVRITFTNPGVDGVRTILSIPSSNAFTFETEGPEGSGVSVTGACRSLVDTYDFARDLIFRASTDLFGIGFANEVIKPAKELQVAVISKERRSNIVTIRTNAPHELIKGQEFELIEIGDGLDGIHFVTEIPDEFSFKFQSLGSDIPFTELPGIRRLNVVTKQLLDNVAIITLESPHSAFVGQTVILEGVDAFFTGRLDSTFNGRFTVTSTPFANVFTFSSGGILNVGPEGVSGGVATFGSKVVYGDFGGYTANSDIGLRFENFEKSGYYQDKQVLRGFEQRTVGEILEQYSNIVDGGFEYRIECDYDYDTAQFTRTFVLFPIKLADPPPEGDVYPVTAFGAEKIVFEYPGNIISFEVDETAEEASTRFFAVGSIQDLGDAASQPYAGAASRELLSRKIGRSWPLIDKSEVLNEVEDELSIYEYAKDFLFESLPPIGVYSITVNGSLDPLVGTYSPGDWCSLIIDDEFIRQRLANDQEPRDDVLIRRIDSFSVNVPDSSSQPEQVELTLVTDWKVDEIGF